MSTRRVYLDCRRPLAVILCIGIALLASGCLWGVVRDAETGALIDGATVSYADSNGQTAQTTTDANGLYAFDPANGPIPAVGNVSLSVGASGYEPLTETRLVEYNDGLPNFWEIQSFSLTPESSESSMYHNETWGFRIAFPDDWTVEEGEEEGTVVMAVAPSENGDEEYLEFCVVMAGELEPGMTLETFFDLMLASLEEDPSGVEQLETGDANLNGQDAKWLLIALTDPDFNTDVNELIYLLAADQRGYMIMCVSEAAQFPSHRSELEGIAESFRLD